MYLATSEQMQEFDKFTINTLKVPGIVLMDHAGYAVARRVSELHPKKVVVVCGKGNNGGDGWVAARWLKHWEATKVHVISTVEPSELSGDAQLAAGMALAAGVPYEVYHPRLAMGEADVYVDAILGTGASRPLTGASAELVSAMNQTVNDTHVTIVAVDVPTGVNASTGEVLGIAVKAHHTVCLGLQKLGTAVSPGCFYAGAVTVADIGIPAVRTTQLATLTEAQDVRAWLPKRVDDAHKGTFGRVGIVVGEMVGAAILAGIGAARSGAGLVIFGEQKGQQHSHVPYEFVLRRSGQAGHVLEPYQDCRALVFGPGLGQILQESLQEASWWSALQAYQGTGVVDADGLRLLMQNLALLKNGQWVLTPHPKECGRLLGWSTQDVQSQRVLAARTLAELTQTVVVLKGYHSLIATPNGSLAVNPTGDASLSTAGTGDVLAGLIGSLLAQGLDPFTAARAGVYLHGLAGELAGKQWSKAGTMASDVAHHIGHAINVVLDSFLRD